MSVSLHDILQDMKRFKNPISDTGRDPSMYTRLGIRNILVAPNFTFNSVTFTGLADSQTLQRTATYPVAISFFFSKDKKISASYKNTYMKMQGVYGEFYSSLVDFKNTTVKVRCNCNDFRYRWSYYLSKVGSLIGRFKTYIKTGENPPVNPNKALGLCKHLTSFIKGLEESNYIISDPFAPEYNIIGQKQK